MANDNGYSSHHRKPKQNDVRNGHQNMQVIGIHAGGHQTFIRVSHRVC